LVSGTRKVSDASRSRVRPLDHFSYFDEECAIAQALEINGPKVSSSAVFIVD
jgi:hypothetical protein